MKHKKNILWVIFVSIYLILIKDELREIISDYWFISLLLFILLLVMSIISSYVKGKISIAIKKMLNFDIDIINNFLYSIILMISACFLIPLLIIFFLEKTNILSFGKQLSVYTSLTISSMLITFYGKKMVEFLNKFVVYDPSNKSVELSQKVVSEDIIKTLLFSIYFGMLIISAIIKYKNLKVLQFDSDNVGVIILAFTTYIALDRIVTTYRKAITLKI